MTIAAIGATPARAEETRRDESGLVEKMETWRDKMSNAFRDTWSSLKGEGHGDSASAASIDFREQDDSYMLRLHLPQRDLQKVVVSLEGKALRVTAPGSDRHGPYEQTIGLSNVAPDAKPEVVRRADDQLIAITVPKAPGSARTEAAAKPTPDASLLPHSDWERDILSRMEKLRVEMDRIFNESFDELGLPENRFDRLGFGSMVDLKDEESAYVVSAYLPNRNSANVSATVEGQTLRIEAKAETVDDSGEGGEKVAHRAQYVQVLTLPGPVQEDKMQVERKEGMLKVTLPKAG